MINKSKQIIFSGYFAVPIFAKDKVHKKDSEGRIKSNGRR